MTINAPELTNLIYSVQGILLTDICHGVSIRDSSDVNSCLFSLFHPPVQGSQTDLQLLGDAFFSFQCVAVFLKKF